MLVLAGTLVALAILVPLGVRALSGGPAFTGLADGATVNPDGLTNVGVTVTGGDLADVQLLVDGAPAAARRDGDRLLLAQPRLAEGAHTLTARLPESVLPDREVSRQVTVDSTAPKLAVEPAVAQDLRKPYTLTGRAEGATALTVGDQQVPLGPDGGFSVTLPTVPGTLHLVARDAVGNNAAQDLVVPTRHPGMRGVHMSALAWTSAKLRDPVLRLAAEHKIDTVQLDIKDESGEVGYRSEVPLAKEIGASHGYYDAKAVVAQLHAAGIRVVGRLVAFRDPVLAQASWQQGKTNRVIQTTGGTPWAGSYGKYAFTSFADPEVVAYNVDLAKEAASFGFDDILYDYVRRPEGALSQMRVPGMTGTPEQAIADFLAKSREAVRAHGAFLGASVFGIAADRPTAIGQDIPAIAKQVDYVAPMVYPSHWGPGEYKVAQPESQPYDITARSVADFGTKVKGTSAQVMPWLQAFSLRKTYGPAEVQAQITAARDSGAPSFLLWNAACRYESAGLQPMS